MRGEARIILSRRRLFQNLITEIHSGINEIRVEADVDIARVEIREMMIFVADDKIPVLFESDFQTRAEIRRIIDFRAGFSRLKRRAEIRRHVRKIHKSETARDERLILSAISEIQLQTARRKTQTVDGFSVVNDLRGILRGSIRQVSRVIEDGDRNQVQYILEFDGISVEHSMRVAKAEHLKVSARRRTAQISVNRRSSAPKTDFVSFCRVFGRLGGGFVLRFFG